MRNLFFVLLIAASSVFAEPPIPGSEGHGGGPGRHLLRRLFKLAQPHAAEMADLVAKLGSKAFEGVDVDPAVVTFLTDHRAELAADVRASEREFVYTAQEHCGLTQLHSKAKITFSYDACEREGVHTVSAAADTLLHESLHHLQLDSAQHAFIEDIDAALFEIWDRHRPQQEAELTPAGAAGGIYARCAAMNDGHNRIVCLQIAKGATQPFDEKALRVCDGLADDANRLSCFETIRDSKFEAGAVDVCTTLIPDVEKTLSCLATARTFAPKLKLVTSDPMIAWVKNAGSQIDSWNSMTSQASGRCRGWQQYRFVHADWQTKDCQSQLVRDTQWTLRNVWDPTSIVEVPYNYNVYSCYAQFVCQSYVNDKP